MARVEIDLREDVLAQLGAAGEERTGRLTKLLAAVLYHVGAISSGRAAELAGVAPASSISHGKAPC